MFAPLAGSAVFLASERSNPAGERFFFFGALIPSAFLFVPLAVFDLPSGTAFASFPVFFSRAFLSAAVSSRLSRATGKPAFSAAAGFVGTLFAWIVYASIADLAGFPVGGFVSASQGLLPATETLAGFAC